MSVNREDFSFKQFAKGDFYVGVNSHLVDQMELKPGQRIVDLACGTGLVTRLILDKVKGARDSIVIGIDASATALREAMAQLGNVKDTAVQFVQSRVEHFSEAIKESVDAVFLCNAIHYIPDKESLIGEVVKKLKPGGSFAFNTAFYEGSHVPDTELFYRKWMYKALHILKNRYGLRPDKSARVEARRTLTPSQYAALLDKSGLTVVKQEINTVPVPLHGWSDICGFEDFIQGVMPGVSLDKASASLIEGVKETFNDLGVKFVSRNWLEIVAVKT